MKKKLKKLLVFHFMLATMLNLMGFNVPLTVAASVNAYYVDSLNGDDSNDGRSEATAWKTLDKVNSTTFQAGDNILFRADRRWDGGLTLQGSGQENSPIVIDMYGIGSKPRFNGNGAVDDVIFINNVEYWEINNLELTNDDDFDVDQEAVMRSGVRVRATDVGVLNHIYLRNLYVHDVDGKHSEKKNGGIIFDVTGTSIKTNYNDILVEGCYVKNVDRTGIRLYDTSWSDNRKVASEWNPSTDIVVRNNVVQDTAGDAIVVRASVSPLIEYNTAIHCCTKTEVANAAIWGFGNDNAVFQYNESYDTVPGSDKQGFDSDYLSNGTIFQYNYSHNNGGGAFLICCAEYTGDFNDGTTIRYNISQNDYVDVFRVSGQATNTTIYNNTIYLDSTMSTNILNVRQIGSYWPDGINFYNNIFYNLGSGEYLYQSGKNILFDNNTYYGNHPASEPNDEHKLIADPKFVKVGSGKNGRLTLGGYKLQSDSPCIDSGLVMEDNGGKDFWGNSLYNGNPDMGALEFYSSDTAAEVPADVSGTSFESAVAALMNWNVLKAGDDGTFGTYTAVSRADFAVALIRGMGLEQMALVHADTGFFSDIASGDWRKGYINGAYQFGVMSESEAGMFAPDTTVTYEQAVKTLVCIAGFENEAEGNGGYPDGYLMTADEHGITAGLESAGSETLTRGIMANLLYNMANNDLLNLNSLGLKAFEYGNDDIDLEGVILPSADAFIRSGVYKDINFGTESPLEIKESVAAAAGNNYHRKVYLKFDLSNKESVDKAILRFYVTVVQQNPTNLTVYGAGSNDWEETGITWANAPVESELISSLSVTSAKKYYEVDVTEFVKNQFEIDKQVTFILTGAGNEDRYIYITDRTNDETPSQLFIEEKEDLSDDNNIFDGTLSAEADAFVRSGTYQLINYGAETLLEVKNSVKTSAGDNYHRKAYLRFNLKKVDTVNKATLRIYVAALQNNSLSTNIAIYGADSNSWTENGVTWAYGPGEKEFISSFVPASSKKYYEIDVTEIIKSQLEADKKVTFIITGTDNQDRYVNFSSRESAENTPELVIE
ncbi:MAG: DUF7594 domain-containing protein [Lachnospiraceae bacterium]